jgi:flagellar motor switch protein FliN/FliY
MADDDYSADTQETAETPDIAEAEAEAPVGEAETPVGEDDWAAAMQEQEQVGDTAETGDDGVDEDDWAAAMQEQAVSEDMLDLEAEKVAAELAAAAESPYQAKPASQLFENLGEGSKPTSLNDYNMILDIPVQITVELGRTKITIRNLLQLAHGSVVELEGLAGEPMDVLVNGTLIAQGEVVVVNDKFGIRLTDIITPAERMRKLHH